MKNLLFALCLLINTSASKTAKPIISNLKLYEKMELSKLENKEIKKENRETKQIKYFKRRKSRDIVISRPEKKESYNLVDSFTISAHIEDKKVFNKNNWLASKKNVKEDILKAVDSFSGPSLTITSGYRNWGGKYHRIGKAIDISYSEEIAYFLNSEEGKTWLELNNLEFFIEDKHEATQEKIPNELIQYWRCISWATALHIHINLKEKDNERISSN